MAPRAPRYGDSLASSSSHNWNLAVFEPPPVLFLGENSYGVLYVQYASSTDATTPFVDYKNFPSLEQLF